MKGADFSSGHIVSTCLVQRVCVKLAFWEEAYIFAPLDFATWNIFARRCPPSINTLRVLSAGEELRLLFLQVW